MRDRQEPLDAGRWTLEEKMQPNEIDRLKVELEEAKALNKKLAGYLLHDYMADIADSNDRVAGFLFREGAPHLYKIGHRLIEDRIFNQVPSGEVLSAIEQALTPDDHRVRKTWNKITDTLKKGGKL